MKPIKNYLLIVLSAFFLGYALVSIVGISESLYGFGELGKNPTFIFFYQGTFWSYFLSSFVSGIIIQVEILKKVKSSLKVGCKSFIIFMIAISTLGLSFFLGILTLFPMIVLQTKLKIDVYRKKHTKPDACIEIKPGYINLILIIVILFLQIVCDIVGRENGFWGFSHIHWLYRSIMLLVDVYLLAGGILSFRSIISSCI